MLLAILYYLLYIAAVLILTSLVLSTAICVFIKLTLEPVKGVCTSTARLDGKVALVTGANQGIGLETARDLASRGATVVIACRNANKSAEAIDDIIKTTGNDNIEFKYLNLARFSSVRKFADDFNNTYDRLDILVNNAGSVALKHEPSEDGIDMAMQINYLGPFLLTNLLLDKIKKSPAGRIIIVSSCMHWFGRVTPNQLDGLNTKSTFMKYSNSKLCDVLWTKALAKRLPKNVTVNSLHPGVVKTDIFRRFYPVIRIWMMFLFNALNFKTPKQGAQTSIHLAVSEEVAGVSGKYFMECVEASYSRIADNEELIEKVWNKSCVLTAHSSCSTPFHIVISC